MTKVLFSSFVILLFFALASMALAGQNAGLVSSSLRAAAQDLNQPRPYKDPWINAPPITTKEWYGLDQKLNDAYAHPDGEEDWALIDYLGKLGVHVSNSGDAYTAAQHLLDRGFISEKTKAQIKKEYKDAAKSKSKSKSGK